MAADPENLDFKIAAMTHDDLMDVCDNEKQMRKKLLQMVSYFLPILASTLCL